MNTAYIILYDKNESSYLSNSLLTFDKFCDSSDILINIFNQKYYDYHKLNSKYNTLLKNYKKNNKLYCIDFYDTLINILNEYLHKYDKYIILNSSLILLNNFFVLNKNINNQYMVSCRNQNIGLYIIDKITMLEIIRNNLSIYNIKNNLQNINDDKCIKTDSIIYNEEPTKEDIKTIIFYENQNCLFCVLKDKNYLKESVAYMNKNNNKIFNVDNNIFGIVIKYDGINLEIEWKINRDSITYSYTRDNNTLFFI